MVPELIDNLVAIGSNAFSLAVGFFAGRVIEFQKDQDKRLL